MPLLFGGNEFILVVQLLIQQIYRKIRTNDNKYQIIIWSNFAVLSFLFSDFHINIPWWAIIRGFSILIFFIPNKYFELSISYYEHINMYCEHVMNYYECISIHCKHIIMYCVHVNTHYECISIYYVCVIIHYGHVTMYRAHVNMHYGFLNTNCAGSILFYRP